MTLALLRLALGLVLLIITIAAAGAQTPSAAVESARGGGRELRLTFLGHAGWEITDDRIVVLVDPFLSKEAILADARAKGTEPVPDPDALIGPDTATIDARVRRADYVLVTHGHLDHALDALYIARKRGTVIIGHESVANSPGRTVFRTVA
jgi:L-ascorbate metabolism protein UlaG (beta-lactamase superfamily)